MTPEQELEKLRRELAEAERKVSQYKNQKEWLLAQCCYQALRFTVKITVA